MDTCDCVIVCFTYIICEFMSKNRARRNIDRVDYKIYNKTGNKIVKNRKGISIMASSVDQELKVVGRLERCIIEYDMK